MFTSFLLPRLPDLGIKLLEHIYLVGFSLFFAVLCGVPLGVWVYRSSRIKHWVLGVANTLQTIPSLAMLGFLLPFFGIGVKPAIIALTLYALLPIIRNTLTGLESVSAEMIEAAKGLGFTYWQRLRLVELPLALPVIVAGIRVSAAMSVGIATLAAFIGAGGLGDFINRGLAANDTRLILLGAIPAALLALSLDFIIARIEQYVSQRKHHVATLSASRKYFKWVVLFLLVVASLASIATWLYFERKPVVRIATKNFTEQFILGEIMAQLIEVKTDLRVDRRFNLGGTLLIQQAMVHGKIDIYPEYTGTGYLLVLKGSEQFQTDGLYDYVKKEYQERFGLEWLTPLGFENANVVAVTKKLADQYQLKQVSDLQEVGNLISVVLPSESMERIDGLPALAQFYGFEFGQYNEMDLGLIYKALSEEKVDLAILFSTDGQLAGSSLVLLEDDRYFFLPYDAAPVIRAETLQKYPEVGEALALLDGKITDEIMRELNYQVDYERRSAKEVAREFLTKIL